MAEYITRAATALFELQPSNYYTTLKHATVSATATQPPNLPHSTSFVAAEDKMRESLRDHGISLPSLASFSSESQPKAKGRSQSSSEGQGEMVKICDECHQKKTKCNPGHLHLSSSPGLAAATRSAVPDALPAIAPFDASENGAGDILQPLDVAQISAAPRAPNNNFALQSPVTSMATQASCRDLNHESSASGSRTAPSSTFANEPAFSCPSSITGAGNRPSRIVTMFITAANVPAHLKVMPSQGNPNGSTPTPAPIPAATAAASRAPSAAPTPSAMPAEAAEHGAATRVYMNTKVTYHLLAGMKELAKNKYVLCPRFSISSTSYNRKSSSIHCSRLTEGISLRTCRPENPLRVLGEFLLARSAQYEIGSATTTSAAAVVSAPAGEDNAMGDE